MSKILEESIESPFLEASLDRDKFLLKNVCLLGPKSRNGRQYPESVIGNAVGMFEGCKAYMNHQSTENKRSGECRDIRDLMGRYEGVRVVNGKLRADLKVLPHMADIVFDLAEHMPGSVGMSINARGVTEMKDGIETVSSITHVNSVDLVTEPAATMSIFESAGAPEDDVEGQDNHIREEKDVMELKDLTLETLKKERPDLVESIAKPLTEKVAVLTEQIQRTKTAGKEADEVIAEAIETCPQLGGLFKGLRESMTKMPDKASMKEMAMATIANAPEGVGSGTTFVEAETKDGKDKKRTGKTSRDDLYEEDGGGA